MDAVSVGSRMTLASCDVDLVNMETIFKRYEIISDYCGYVPGLSSLSGQLRFQVGLIQTVAFAVFAASKFIGSFASENGSEMRKESYLCLRYSAHGIANMLRSFVECIPFVNLACIVYDLMVGRFGYDSEGLGSKDLGTATDILSEELEEPRTFGSDAAVPHFPFLVQPAISMSNNNIPVDLKNLVGSDRQFAYSASYFTQANSENWDVVDLVPSFSIFKGDFTDVFEVNKKEDGVKDISSGPFNFNSNFPYANLDLDNPWVYFAI